MKSFWKLVGKGFAHTGGGLLKGAAWASQHPEVLQIIAQVVNSVQK